MKKLSFFAIILIAGLIAGGCRSEEEKALRTALNPYEIISLSESEKQAFLADTEKQIEKAKAETDADEKNNTLAFREIAAGYACVGLGRFEEALKHFEAGFSVMQGLTSYPQFYYYAGVAAAGQAKQSAVESQKALLFEKAIYYYNRALELSSTYANAYYGLGVIYYFELGDSDAGLQYALKTVAAEPDHFGARYMAARIYIEKGENAKAFEQYNYIIKHADKKTAESAVRNKEFLEADG